MSFYGQQDFYLEVSKGNIPGHERVSFGGHNPNTTTTEQTMWPEGGDVPLPLTVAVTMTISSDNANDAAAGTGATLVLVHGIDGSGDRVSEVIVPNGTTAVTSVNTFIHINQIVMAGSGSTNQNQGTIYIGTGVVAAGKPAVVYNLMEPSVGISRSMYYYVPNNYHLTIINSTTTVDSNKIALSRFCTHTSAGRTCAQEFHISQTNNTFNQASSLIPPNTFIEFRCEVDTGSGEIDLGIGAVLIHTDYVNL